MAIFNSGTKTIFHQTSAPTGWVKETVNYDNHALRVVSGSSLSTGGSVDFQTAFPTNAHLINNTGVVYFSGPLSLTATNLAAHNHTMAPAPTRAFIGAPRISTTTAPVTIPVTSGVTSTSSGPSGSSSGAHEHLITTTVTGNFWSNSPNSNIGVNYIDVIIATLT